MRNEQEKPAVPSLMLRMRPETREKLDAIRAVKRWTIIEAIDAVCDYFIEKNQIELPGEPTAKSA
jgi:hypothetical protein